MIMMDFEKVRGWKGAILFYLGFLVLFVLVGAFAGGVAALMTGASSYAEGASVGQRAGLVISVVFCPALGILILLKKGQMSHLGYWLLVVIAGLLSMFLGAIGGLLPIAFLTTRETQKEPGPTVKPTGQAGDSL